MNDKNKYKEEIIRATQLWENGDITRENLEYIFPELAESEDERIRKELIAFLKENLETGRADETWSLSGLERWIAWLKKQGEQKDINPTLLEKEKMDNAFTKMMFKDKTALEAIHEEKVDNVNKIEQKFYEGDWIVYKNDICQIVKREEGCNKLVTTFGIEKELVNERNLSTARLWTIQDAKDGDVLAYITDEEDLWIMIYQSLYEPYEGHVHYHALLVNDNFSDKGTCCICINDLKPATKEQRDYLFIKMRESGYEWDNENKKLREIVQKSTDKIEPQFHEGNWIVNNDTKDVFLIKSIYNGYCTLEDIKGNIISPCLPPCESESHLWTIQDAKDGDILLSKYNQPFIYNGIFDEDCVGAYCGIDKFGNGFLEDTFSCDWSCKEGVKPTTKEQRDLFFQKMNEAGYEFDFEKKELKKFHIIDEDKNEIDYCFTKMMNGEKVSSAWSEKDENFFANICSIIDADRNFTESAKRRCKDWLKSIKDRVQPQNMWKPSKDQIIALRWVLNNIPYNKHKEEISGLLDQIKDLFMEEYD